MDIDKSTSFLRMKKRRRTQRTLLPGHEHGKFPHSSDHNDVVRVEMSPERLMYRLTRLIVAGDDEFDEELTEGYRGMADVEDLLWDDETDQGAALMLLPERSQQSVLKMQSTARQPDKTCASNSKLSSAFIFIRSCSIPYKASLARCRGVYNVHRGGQVSHPCNLCCVTWPTMECTPAKRVRLGAKYLQTGAH